MWKDHNAVLSYNRALAEARLQYLKSRFDREPELEVKYRAVIEDCVAKEYARRLSKDQAAAVRNITWYIPHHAVTNPNKPGKVRVVFDAAAKYNGTCLNDQLLQGPCLTNDLIGVLIRFRKEEVAFSADAQGMFYQTSMNPSDTDALRFLWWPSSIEDRPEGWCTFSVQNRLLVVPTRPWIRLVKTMKIIIHKKLWKRSVGISMLTMCWSPSQARNKLYVWPQI